MEGEEQFVLNLTTLAAIGGVMGVLTGAISFLTKALLEAKDKQIEDLKNAAVHQQKTLKRDRDYWRDFAMHLLDPAEQARLAQAFPRHEEQEE